MPNFKDTFDKRLNGEYNEHAANIKKGDKVIVNSDDIYDPYPIGIVTNVLKQYIEVEVGSSLLIVKFSLDGGRERGKTRWYKTAHPMTDANAQHHAELVDYVEREKRRRENRSQLWTLLDEIRASTRYNNVDDVEQLEQLLTTLTQAHETYKASKARMRNELH